MPPWGFEPRPQPAAWINSFVREIQYTSRSKCIKPLDQTSPHTYCSFRTEAQEVLITQICNLTTQQGIDFANDLADNFDIVGTFEEVQKFLQNNTGSGLNVDTQLVETALNVASEVILYTIT